MSKKSAKDFASTSQKGLPEHKKPERAVWATEVRCRSFPTSRFINYRRCAMSKNVPAPAMTKSDRDWQAESDARTLSEHHVIHGNYRHSGGNEDSTMITTLCPASARAFITL